MSRCATELGKHFSLHPDDLLSEPLSFQRYLFQLKDSLGMAFLTIDTSFSQCCSYDETLALRSRLSLQTFTYENTVFGHVEVGLTSRDSG